MEVLKNSIPPNMYDIIERAGICTIKQILCLSIWDIKKATKMRDEDIHFLKTIVATHLCPINVITVENIKVINHIKTGCSYFDKMLNGGFRIGSLTELYGESGIGKTQLAMQVAIQCGKNGCVYICTEDVFPIKRFNQLVENTQRTSIYDPRQYMFIEHITEAQDLISCIRVRLPKLLKQTKISTIIIDSIAAPFRSDMINYIQRAEDLRELGTLLLKLAQNYNLAVICINQVTSSFDEFDHLLPSLGLAWSNIISYRLLLKRTSDDIILDKLVRNVRELIAVFGPDLDNKLCKFIIDESGIKTL